MRERLTVGVRYATKSDAADGFSVALGSDPAMEILVGLIRNQMAARGSDQNAFFHLPFIGFASRPAAQILSVEKGDANPPCVALPQT